MIDVWLRLPTLTLKRTFSQWLSGVIRNYRHEQTRQTIRARSNVEVTDFTLGTHPELTQSFTTLAVDEVQGKLCLMILDGCTLSQAAAGVGLSENAARKRLRKLGEG